MVLDFWHLGGGVTLLLARKPGAALLGGFLILSLSRAFARHILSASGARHGAAALGSQIPIDTSDRADRAVRWLSLLDSSDLHRRIVERAQKSPSRSREGTPGKRWYPEDTAGALIHCHRPRSLVGQRNHRHSALTASTSWD